MARRCVTRPAQWPRLLREGRHEVPQPQVQTEADGEEDERMVAVLKG